MTDSKCGARKRDGSDDPCGLPAGWGTDHVGDGRCKLHGGNAGAPRNNQNASKHGLYSDPHHYFESLSLEQQDYIEEVASMILDRVQKQKATVNQSDQIRSRAIAIQFHISSKASSYIQSKSEREDGVVSQPSYEGTGPLLREFRRCDTSIFQRLSEIGVFDESESQEVDSLKSWRRFIEAGD